MLYMINIRNLKYQDHQVRVQIWKQLAFFEKLKSRLKNILPKNFPKLLMKVTPKTIWLGSSIGIHGKKIAFLTSSKEGRLVRKDVEIEEG